jgi:hypothetical protein
MGEKKPQNKSENPSCKLSLKLLINDSLVSSSSSTTVKHPFFMAPAERSAMKLTRLISESNALNRAIQINLISEDEEETTEHPKNDDGKLFFAKRTKLNRLARNDGVTVKLKRISSSDPPPFPCLFQLSLLGTRDISNEFTIDSRLMNQIHSTPNMENTTPLHVMKRQHENSIKLAELIRETHSNINFATLKTLFGSVIPTPPTHPSPFHSSLYTEMDLALHHDNNNNNNTKHPILAVLLGPSGVGKTSEVERLAESFGLRLITIDSTCSPRNGKTFETLQTTLTHCPSQNFFTANSTNPTKSLKGRIAILFDEIEIAFENDRGYWSSLEKFLQLPISRSVPIFITSNASNIFLETIIKFPEHAQFYHYHQNRGDWRKFKNHSDFIGRLHRIDTSIEYEHLVQNTGYYHVNNVIDLDNDSTSSISNNVICEALKWNGIIENISTSNTTFAFDQFSYSEAASLADIFLSIDDNLCCDGSIKIHFDPIENLHLDDLCTESTFAAPLLYSSIPELYSNSHSPTSHLAHVARALLEKTIHASNVPVAEPKATQCNWKNLSSKLSQRFFNYTRSLQSPHIWSQDLLQHVLFMEKQKQNELFATTRRKKPHYRYIGEELLSKILSIPE